MKVHHRIFNNLYYGKFSINLNLKMTQALDPACYLCLAQGYTNDFTHISHYHRVLMRCKEKWSRFADVERRKKLGGRRCPKSSVQGKIKLKHGSYAL